MLAFSADDAKLVYDLPPALNSFERKLVHELAEEFKLNHSSAGTGALRHISVWKDGFVGIFRCFLVYLMRTCVCA